MKLETFPTIFLYIFISTANMLYFEYISGSVINQDGPYKAAHNSENG